MSERRLEVPLALFGVERVKSAFYRAALMAFLIM